MNKKIIIILCLIGLLLVLCYGGIHSYVNFQTLKDNRTYLLELVDRYYWLSALGYIVLYIIVATLSLPIAAPLTVMSGFLFGVVPGALYTNIGATLGATATFIFFRHFLGLTVQKKYYTHLIEFNKNIDSYGSNYLLIMRLMAAVPFFVANIVASCTTISVRTFIWTTSLGIIPGSLVFAYAGKNIGSINSINEIFSLSVISVFILLVALSLVSLLIKKMYIQKHG